MSVSFTDLHNSYNAAKSGVPAPSKQDNNSVSPPSNTLTKTPRTSNAAPRQSPSAPQGKYIPLDKFLTLGKGTKTRLDFDVQADGLLTFNGKLTNAIVVDNDGNRLSVDKINMNEPANVMMFDKAGNPVSLFQADYSKPSVVSFDFNQPFSAKEGTYEGLLDRFKGGTAKSLGDMINFATPIPKVYPAKKLSEYGRRKLEEGDAKLPPIFKTQRQLPGYSSEELTDLFLSTAGSFLPAVAAARAATLLGAPPTAASMTAVGLQTGGESKAIDMQQGKNKWHSGMPEAVLGSLTGVGMPGLHKGRVPASVEGAQEIMQHGVIEAGQAARGQPLSDPREAFESALVGTMTAGVVDPISRGAGKLLDKVKGVIPNNNAEGGGGIQNKKPNTPVSPSDQVPDQKFSKKSEPKFTENVPPESPPIQEPKLEKGGKVEVGKDGHPKVVVPPKPAPTPAGTPGAAKGGKVAKPSNKSPQGDKAPEERMTEAEGQKYQKAIDKARLHGRNRIERMDGYEFEKEYPGIFSGESLNERKWRLIDIARLPEEEARPEENEVPQIDASLREGNAKKIADALNPLGEGGFGQRKFGEEEKKSDVLKSGVEGSLGVLERMTPEQIQASSDLLADVARDYASMVEKGVSKLLSAGVNEKNSKGGDGRGLGLPYVFDKEGQDFAEALVGQMRMHYPELAKLGDRLDPLFDKMLGGGAQKDPIFDSLVEESGRGWAKDVYAQNREKLLPAGKKAKKAPEKSKKKTGREPEEPKEVVDAVPPKVSDKKEPKKSKVKQEDSKKREKEEEVDPETLENKAGFIDPKKMREELKKPFDLKEVQEKLNKKNKASAKRFGDFIRGEMAKRDKEETPKLEEKNKSEQEKIEDKQKDTEALDTALAQTDVKTEEKPKPVKKSNKVAEEKEFQKVKDVVGKLMEELKDDDLDEPPTATEDISKKPEAKDKSADDKEFEELAKTLKGISELLDDTADEGDDHLKSTRLLNRRGTDNDVVSIALEGSPKAKRLKKKVDRLTKALYELNKIKPLIEKHQERLAKVGISYDNLKQNIHNRIERLQRMYEEANPDWDFDVKQIQEEAEKLDLNIVVVDENAATEDSESVEVENPTSEWERDFDDIKQEFWNNLGAIPHPDPNRRITMAEAGGETFILNVGKKEVSEGTAIGYRLVRVEDIHSHSPPIDMQMKMTAHDVYEQGGDVYAAAIEVASTVVAHYLEAKREGGTTSMSVASDEETPASEETKTVGYKAADPMANVKDMSKAKRTSGWRDDMKEIEEIIRRNYKALNGVKEPFYLIRSFFEYKGYKFYMEASRDAHDGGYSLIKLDEFPEDEWAEQPSIVNQPGAEFIPLEEMTEQMINDFGHPGEATVYLAARAVYDWISIVEGEQTKETEQEESVDEDAGEGQIGTLPKGEQAYVGDIHGMHTPFTAADGRKITRGEQRVYGTTIKGRRMTLLIESFLSDGDPRVFVSVNMKNKAEKEKGEWKVFGPEDDVADSYKDMVMKLFKNYFKKPGWTRDTFEELDARAKSLAKEVKAMLEAMEELQNDIGEETTEESAVNQVITKEDEVKTPSKEDLKKEYREVIKDIYKLMQDNEQIHGEPKHREWFYHFNYRDSSYRFFVRRNGNDLGYGIRVKPADKEAYELSLHEEMRGFQSNDIDKAVAQIKDVGVRVIAHDIVYEQGTTKFYNKEGESDGNLFKEEDDGFVEPEEVEESADKEPAEERTDIQKRHFLQDELTEKIKKEMKWDLQYGVHLGSYTHEGITFTSEIPSRGSYSDMIWVKRSDSDDEISSFHRTKMKLQEIKDLVAKHVAKFIAHDKYPGETKTTEETTADDDFDVPEGFNVTDDAKYFEGLKENINFTWKKNPAGIHIGEAVVEVEPGKPDTFYAAISKWQNEKGHDRWQFSITSSNPKYPKRKSPKQVKYSAQLKTIKEYVVNDVYFFAGAYRKGKAEGYKAKTEEVVEETVTEETPKENERVLRFDREDNDWIVIITGGIDKVRIRALTEGNEEIEDSIHDKTFDYNQDNLADEITKWYLKNVIHVPAFPLLRERVQ